MHCQTLVIDGMNVFKTALSTGRGLSAPDGKPTGGIFHGIRTLLVAQNNFSFENVVILWDRGPYWRKSVYPEYKANRNTQRTDQEIAEYEFQYRMFRNAVEWLGISQLEAPGLEADDLAYTMSNVLYGKNLFWSNDQDWWQLVDEQNMVYSHRVKQLINHENFQKETGFRSPERYVKVKIIAGDGGDNIIGVKGVGPAKAEKFLDGTLTGVFPQKIQEFIDDGRYAMNELLVDLSKCPIDPSENWTFLKTSPNPEKFRDMLQGLAIGSLDRAQWLSLMDRADKSKLAL